MNKLNNLEDLIEKINNNDGFRFKVKAIANSKNNSFEFCEELVKVKIKEKAIEGKANKAIIEFLAKSLHIAKSRITIVNGEKSSIKLIEILS